MEILLSTIIPISKGVFGFSYPVVLIIMIAGIYRYFSKIRDNRLKITKEKMEFMSSYFSEKSNLTNDSYTEFAYNYFFDSGVLLHRYVIDYFMKCDNTNVMLSEYVEARRYFDFKPSDEHPMLKEDYRNDNGLERDQKKWGRYLFISLMLMISPVFFITFSSDEKLLFSGLLSISSSLAGVLSFYIFLLEERRVDAAVRLVKLIEEYKEGEKSGELCEITNQNSHAASGDHLLVGS